jgi:hypothetical protein
MAKRIFSIEWDDDLGPLWMNKDNLAICVNAYVGVDGLEFEDVTDLIQGAMDNIGIPQPGYPAPIAYAHELLEKAYIVQGGHLDKPLDVEARDEIRV